MKRIGIIGCGAWATTIAKLCAENGHKVRVWVHRERYLSFFENDRENRIALPGIALPPMSATTQMSDVIHGSDYLLYCVPTKFTETLAHFVSEKPQVPVLCLSKGVVGAPHWTLCQYMQDILGAEGPPIGVLSGPNLASEIAQQKPAAAVVGCHDEGLAKLWATLLSRPYFRVYFSADCIGISWGGILKNYLAIAAGICDGLGLGSNTKAALLTRGLAEMSRILCFFGGNKETLYGLSGVGDLIATCASPDSRNYQVGFGLAQNHQTETSHTVAEGVKTVAFLYDWNLQAGLPLPILTELYAVLYNTKPVTEAMDTLLGREIREE